MSKLGELITVRPGSEPFINFEKSLRSDPVCSGFVPVQSTLEVFGFLKQAAAAHSPSRAVICYGTYGSGKSRLCVLLARLFADGFDARPLGPVWDRMEKRGWGEELKGVRDVMLPGGREWRPWLVVPMHEAGGGGTLDNALLHSLVRAVKGRGLPDAVLGVTIYEAAARRLEHMIQEGREYSPLPQTPYPTAESLIRALREDTSQDALEFFRDWHLRETAGVTLEAALQDQPHLSGNAAQLYANVADAVTAHGYDGVVVIWDEFGFAIEELLRGTAHGHRSLGREVMDLQNFVEQACSGDALSGKVVFLGFTHLSLNEYGSRARVNEQEKTRLAVVSGRFRQPDIPIRLSVTEAEGYHLLGGMRELTPEGSALLSTDFPCMRSLAKKMPSLPLWEHFTAEQCYHDIIKTAYPLHPATSSVLLMLSDRIAQVNRTAFYFMHDRENGGVAGQLDELELPEPSKIGSEELIRVPDMYQFFEQAIREHGAEVFRKYEEALLRFPGRSDLDEAVMRTVLILKVANVSPTTDMLAFCLCDAVSEESQAAALHSALERCTKANALWRNEATAVWDFFRFPVDIEEPIEEELAAIPKQDGRLFLEADKRVQEELAEYIGTFDLEPAESGIVRRVRVGIPDIGKGKDGIEPVNPAVKEPGEGWCSASVNVVLAYNEAIIRHWCGQVAQLEASCSYFLIPQAPFVLREDIRRFIAILNILDRGNLDKNRREMLDAMFTALRSKLRHEFASYFGSEGFKSGACCIMKAGSSAPVSGITCWNDLLLRVGEDVSQHFPSEIRVRCGSYNEWDGGRRATPIERIVEHILSFSETGAFHTNYLGFKNTSQEAAVVDGVLVENSYLTQDLHGKWCLASVGDRPQQPAPDPVDAIRQHFTQGGAVEKPFARLFSQLIEPPFGIPNGIIPILVAFALRDDMDRVALYVRRGASAQRVSSKSELPKHLASLAHSPKRYTSRYEQLAGKNRYVFKVLAAVLRMPFESREMHGEVFYGKCREIRKRLGEWAKCPPDLAVSSSAITEAQRELIKGLRGPVLPQLPELAEAAVRFFCEDVDCRAELEGARVETTRFPHMQAYWDRFLDALSRLTSSAEAPVSNVLERVTDGGQVSLDEVLKPLVTGDADPLARVVKEIAEKKPRGVKEVIAAISGKAASAIENEDCGYAKAFLEIADRLRPKAGELKVVLPDRTLSLPPLTDDRGRPEVESALAELRDRLGLSPEHIARLVFDLLFPGDSKTDEAADQETRTL